MREEKLRELLQDMSTQEKILQLYQMPGQIFDENAAMTGMFGDANEELKYKYLIGSTLSIHGAEELIAIQKDYMEHQPHHIPLLFMLDVIHGHKTVFPAPLAQGATFDPALVREAAEIAANEASADGIQVVFSPMSDLARDARWGRVVESTGEDPYLNSQMTDAMVRGYQGDDPSKLDQPENVAACVKHFAAYSATTAGRDYREADISEYSLRDQYLTAYKAGVDAGAAMVMTSFNPINGIPATGNQWLMKEILREEMGFEGVLISDWGAVGEIVSHGAAENDVDAAELAMNAQVDIDMCAHSYRDGLQTLLDEGRLTMEQIDRAVWRVLKLKNDLGLFEDPFHGASKEKAEKLLLCDAHRQAARKAAAKSFVLLKNEDKTLPLQVQAGQKIAFIGPYVDEADYRSSWAVSSDAADCVSIKNAALQVLVGANAENALQPDGKTYQAGEAQVRFAQGCLMLENDSDLDRGQFHVDNWEEKNTELMMEAAETAAWADVIVLAIGEHKGQSGESTSRTNLTIPKVQRELQEVVYAMAKEKPQGDAKVVTLLFNGRPLELGDAAAQSDALLECWLPCTEAGTAILDVILGEKAPEGKLPMSFPHSVGQEPLYYNTYSTGRPRPMDRLSIFTTRYIDCPNEALYPFGYGLTYSAVEVSKITLKNETTGESTTGAELAETVLGAMKPVSKENEAADTAGNDAKVAPVSAKDLKAIAMNAADTLTASVNVTNIGDTASTETLQLYIRDVKGSRIRPVRELKGFEKVSLQPGESKEVSFQITEDMLCFWTAKNEKASEPGEFRVFIGTDSTTMNAASFNLQ